MKIAVCLRTWGEKGGIGAYSRYVLNALLEMDRENKYILLYSDKEHMGRYSEYPNVSEVLVQARTKWTWDQVATPLAAAREGADIIWHAKFAIPLLSPLKTVMVLHGSERFVYPQFSERSDMFFFKTIYPFYLRRATAIISVSENARKDVIKYLHINPEKIHTVHLAPAGNFRKIDDKALLEQVRAKYNLPERFILNVGLIYPGKNLPNLFRALKIVREKEDVKLVIAGTGRRMYEDELAVINQRGLENDVVMPGYVPHEDLPAVYNLAEAVVFPSFYESFPAVPVEANACGCPVVTSRTGGTPEAAGDAALYVDPLDVQDIADATLRALTDADLRKSLIEKGYLNARRFSWEKTARKTLDVFEGMMEKGSKPYAVPAHKQNS